MAGDAETEVPRPFDADEVYRRLGVYVVIFQWFEDKLLEINARLHAGEEWWDARARFAGRRFIEKVDLAASAFEERMDELRSKADAGELSKDLGDAATEWKARFSGLMERCRALNTRRNTIVHSSYVHLESFNEVLGIVRSKLGRRAGALTLDQGDALGDLNDAIASAAPLGIEVGIAAVQLVHWRGYWAPRGS